MSFNLSYFDTVSVAGNSNAPRVFCYKSTTDALATIIANAYFDTVKNSVRVGDLIYVKATDAEGFVTVDAVDLTANANPAVTVKTSDALSAEVTVTSAELLALRATPKTLVAAPGAGRMLQFITAELILDYNSVGYTESADNMAVKYTDGSGVKVSEDIEATGFIDQTADTVTNAVFRKDTIVAASGAANKALVLHNIGDGEYAAGNSPMRVKITYRVLKTGL